ncbi:MAG: acetoacetate decarboxylase family protein [Alphaproteobacteria bacterium]
MSEPNPNNVPLHSPLFPSDLMYGSDDAESVSVLVEVEEDAVRNLLRPTPFEFVSAHAWVEVMALRTAWGVEPFAGGGVLVPARYKGTLGAYYALCYVDSDESLALGREPFGYPKKYARSSIQRTGRAATAAIVRRDARVEISVITDDRARAAPPVPRYPHLLLQVLPSAETPDVLLKRVIARDTAAASRMSVVAGEAAVAVEDGTPANELGWLADGVAVYGAYAAGAFHGAYGKVLGVEEVGRELIEQRYPSRSAAE